MKLRTTLKIATSASVILLCLGILMSFYFRMSANEAADEFDLFTLVPADSKFVVATNHFMELVEQLNDFQEDKELEGFHQTSLFSEYYRNILRFTEHMPHGLSKQMNNVLISFHELMDQESQIMYCRLNTDDEKLMQQLLFNHVSADFPTRKIAYRGEDIRIIPLRNDKFLAAFANKTFWVASYQMHLIERVIDAFLDNSSVLRDASFQSHYQDNKMSHTATIYTSSDAADMECFHDQVSALPSSTKWMRYDVNITGHTLFFSGSDYAACADSNTLNDTLKVFRMDRDLLRDTLLPASSHYFLQTKLPESLTLADDCFTGALSLDDYSHSVWALLKKYADENMTLCVFGADSISTTHTVLTFPLTNKPGAQHALTELHRLSRTYSSTGLSGYSIQSGHLTQGVAFPCRELYNKLTGNSSSGERLNIEADVADPSSDDSINIISIYHDHLILADNAVALNAYLQEVENTRLLIDSPYYKSVFSVLAPRYVYLLSADMDAVASLPSESVRYIPGYFLHHIDYFSRFILSVQLSMEDGRLYPQVVLSCKKTTV